MTLRFSHFPGSHERHLRRRAGNPLFPDARRKVDQNDIDKAREHDEEEAEAFLERFRGLVQRAIDLRPNEESQKVLDLKGELERAYVECTALAGDHHNIRDALRKLIHAVMAAVRSSAGDDPKARAELDDEERARHAHFELLTHPLVADLMRPDTPIPAEELTATLLSETVEALRAALWLFDAEPLGQVREEARTLYDGLTEGQREAIPDLKEKLTLLETQE